MDTRHLVFKSHPLDRDVDRALRALADHFQATRGALFRMCVASGLMQLDRGVALPPTSDDAVAALQTAYIHFDDYERLRVLAFRLRLEHDDLRRRVVRLGLLSLQAATGFVALRPSEQP